MSILPPEIDFRVDKAASPDRMNRATAHIDARLRALEAYKPSFDQLFAELQIFGLQRVNEAVAPLLQELSRVQALGFLNAPIQPGTTAYFALGSLSVTISEDRRNVFTPSPWVMLVSDSVPDSYVLGRKLSYDQDTGELQINVTNQWGANSLLADVTVWGVAGGALSALESATKAVDAKVIAQAASATAVSAAATISGSTSTAVSAAQTASTAANNAAASAAQAAASAASISSGPVLSVNMKTGAVTLSAADVGAYSTAQIDSKLAVIDSGTF
jgi:hypothetical protein